MVIPKQKSIYLPIDISIQLSVVGFNSYPLGFQAWRCIAVASICL